MKKLLILILIIVAGYFAWTKYGASSEWQTYRGGPISGYPSYEVMYPPDWTLKIINPTTVIISNDDTKEEVIIESSGVQSRYSGPTEREYVTKIGNYDVHRYDQLTNNGDVFHSLVEFTDKLVDNRYPAITLNALTQKQLKIVYSDDELPSRVEKVEGNVKNFDVMEKILSTFKFIEYYD